MASRWMTHIVFGGLLICSVVPARAAISHGPANVLGAKSAQFPAAVPLSVTLSALSLPVQNRLQLLVRQGPAGYRNLVTIMFDAKASMETRWRAVTAVGRIGGELAKPELERAFQSKEWFMRNAALVSMQDIDQAQAVGWAHVLLSDKALVVRAAAVQTLVRANDKASAELLWEKLYAKENFKGKQSLFIRRRIVEALARIGGKGNEGRFIEVLNDSDESLHPIAVVALERATKRTLGKPKDQVSAKRAQWQQWWSENSRTSL